MPKRYYVTTPIYYVNSVPHIGTALTTFVADATKRYRKMRGENVVFLTGTDENGLKVMEAAAAAGESAQQFVDRISQAFVDCWHELRFDYDVFMRTTSDRHREAVQALFSVLKDNGHIYVDKYEGWYDVSSETFVKESDLIDGKSPDGNEVRWVEEENYFFRLSSFGDRLLAHIEANPNFLLPESRKNEVVSFIHQGLRDICITRSNPGWGIPVPGDDSKVVYVWFDALINYLAATGWPNPGWEDLWPADVHWMAKEIFTRFHATLWPAMLMAANLPLPKTVIAHGWFTFGDSKISKSKGNAIAPLDLRDEYVQVGCQPDLAVDVVRFSLARCLPYDGDTNYNRPEVERIYNTDLANDLGNALNRTLSMVHKFGAGKVPTGEIEADVRTACDAAKSGVEVAMETFRLDRAVESAMDLVRFLNKYIDTRAPWALAKAEDPALPAVLRSMLFSLRTAEGLLRPFIPATADAIAEQLSHSPLAEWQAVGKPETLVGGTEVQSPTPMFPRVDDKNRPTSAMDSQPSKSETAAPAQPKPEKPKKAAPEPPTEIEFADFMKVNLRVARIVDAEPVEGSEKLMKLQVTVGEHRRQIIAGIQKRYQPIDLIGRQIIVVFNLKPAKLMGHESQGMLLAADDIDGSPILLQPEIESPDGASVH